VDLKTAKELIKKQASALGFFSCGIVRAEFLKDHQPRLKQWIDDERHGEMAYMENHFDKRLDPAKLVENARSLIVVLQNYFPEIFQPDNAAYKVSHYAYGRDYHFVIREKLVKLQAFIRLNLGDNHSKLFTDSVPVLERAWAVKAGLGWIGKNSMLITPRNGSYFFIGGIITNLELDYDQPYGGDFCGDCTRCLDACPTKAIGNDRMINSTQCISYLTIEKKGNLPDSLKGKYKQWIFGCDICQQVCPWNRFSIPHHEPAFKIIDPIKNWPAEKWETLDEIEFKQVFAKSPLMRVKLKGIRRNISYLKGPA